MVQPFQYAQIKDTNGQRWYVEFYCIFPATSKLKRVRWYSGRYRTETLRKRHLHRLQREINAKLELGWNPFIEELPSAKIYQSVYSALDWVLSQRLKEIEKSSIPNYVGRIKVLKDYLETIGKSKMACHEFTPATAQEFMEYCYNTRDIGGVTFNNYLIDYRGFFNTLIRAKYFTLNPFKEIAKKKEKIKAKRPWAMWEQTAYLEHCREFDFDFYITSMYCFYFGLRPKEICLLKVSDVNFEYNRINVIPSIAKNDRQRLIPIPKVFLNELKNYLQGIPGNYFLVGYGFKPSLKKIAPTRIPEHFRPIADQLKFEKQVFFYGLKDTCAEMLIRAGIHPKTIQTLFDHTSMKTTDAYLSQIHNPQLEQLTHQFPAFGG